MKSCVVRFDIEPHDCTKTADGEVDETYSRGGKVWSHNLIRKDDKDSPRILPCVIVDKEIVGSIVEYAENCLIVGCEMNPNLYVFKDLVNTSVIRCDDST